MRPRTTKPCCLFALSLTLLSARAGAYELELGSAVAGFGGEIRIPLLVSSTVAVKGVQVVFEWDTADGTGVDIEVDAAIAALPGVMISGPSVATGWMAIGVTTIFSPILGDDVRLGTVVLTCAGGPAAASSSVRFRDGVYRTSPTSPLLSNVVTAGGAGTGMPLVAVTAASGLVLSDGSFECRGTSEDCDDGADNDGDGLVDCDDPECVAEVELSRAALEFDAVRLGEDRTLEVELANRGPCALAVSEATITSATGPGFAYDGLASFSVAPGASQTLRVTFRPLVEGPTSGALRLTTDGDRPLVEILLSGRGESEPRDVAFGLSLEGPEPRVIDGGPGALYTASWFAVIETVTNRSGEGPLGWAVSLGAHGMRITDITTQGTVGATTIDAPPGLRDASASFELSELTTSSAARPDNDGAVSAVVLSFTRPVTLPAAGRFRVARLEVEARFPALGDCETGRVWFVDGRHGSGQPVDNVVVHDGVTLRPALGERRLELCGGPVAFELGFDESWPEVTYDAAGNRLRRTLGCTLTTTSNDTGIGANAWSIGVASEGLAITAITTRATVAAAVGDTPPGLVNGGFVVAELTRSSAEHPDNDGAVCAVVLSFDLPVTLPLAGTSVTARIDVEGEMPALGDCRPARVFYRDGLVGCGQPVSNVVVHDGRIVRPATRDLRTALCAGGFVRGDTDSNGSIEMADGIISLTYLFRGGPPPACFDAADADDNGVLELTDPVVIFGWLYTGGRIPSPPSPLSTTYSASNCGADPSSDRLGCAVLSPTCS